MKAWQFSEFGGIEKLSLREVELPTLREGEAAIRVSHTGVNHVDRLVVNGRLKWVTLPKIPGSEYVGVVSRVGPGVNDFREGDRVAIFPKMYCGKCRYCRSHQEGVCLEAWNPERAPVDLSTNMLPSAMDGGWAEETVIPERNLVLLPEKLDFKASACLPLSAMAAHHMVSQASPVKGETALVMGATGGVGHFATQLLKIAGCTVLGVINNDSQQGKMSELGVDHTITRTGTNIRERTLELTDGLGVDIVFDSLGQATFQNSINSLAPCGRYVSAGTLTGPSSELNLMQVYSRQLRIIGSTTGSMKDLQSVVKLTSERKLKPVVSDLFSFEQLPEAIERLMTPGRLGKVIVKVGAE